MHAQLIRILWPFARAMRALSACVLAAAAGSLAHAAPSAAANAGAGIATAGTPTGAAACASCHGARGEGVGAFSHLAGYDSEDSLYGMTVNGHVLGSGRR